MRRKARPSNLAGPIIRSSNLQFFVARAEQARAEAEAATLDHVRERCRRSEAAWNVLADKARRSELLRVEDAKRKAASAASMNVKDDIEIEGPEDPATAPEREITIL